ncbi:hypothetical protein DNF23_47095 [Pseudomonas syringae pv. pisi]|nr:hypothetical protein DND47_21065 [Pseudomonas syringae pv. syringae]
MGLARHLWRAASQQQGFASRKAFPGWSAQRYTQVLISSENRAFVRADLSAMGCEAALKQPALVMSDTPYATILLPVPGRSWTSEASSGSAVSLKWRS